MKCNLPLPCATQNELDADKATALIANGCIAVSEGANMSTTLEGTHSFKVARFMFAPGKAANAGGMVVSGPEMSQYSERRSWKKKRTSADAASHHAGHHPLHR